MAKFKVELPNDLIKQFEKLEINTPQMLEEMTRAGAKVVEDLVRAKMPKALYEALEERDVRLSKTYRTPSDDGAKAPQQASHHVHRQQATARLYAARTNTARHPNF